MANLVIILIVSFFFSTGFSNNQTDLLSLLAFKSSLDDPQGALRSWNQTTHFCRWSGIQCGRRHSDRVAAINLTSQGLVGPLSPHVGNLSFLRTFILQNNTFHGPIPREISLLKWLEILDFQDNAFTGAIPTNLSQCPNLYEIFLYNNHLSGPIPMDLTSLSKLKYLSLRGNTLSSHIPAFIGNITSLRILSLASCNLRGEIPKSLGQLQNLIFLDLAENDLSNTIPPSLFNISSFQLLALDVNRLSGVIPSTVGFMLPNLIELYLWGNQLSGHIPSFIANASFLEILELRGSNFSGPMPRLGTLAHLESINIVSNFLQDDISFISTLTNSTSLTYLLLANNLFTGSLPHSVANLSTQLRVLHISNNKIHGNLPMGIGNLVNLDTFVVSNNDLDGPIPVDFYRLSNLLYLHLARNRFSGHLSFSFQNFTRLSNLFLDKNKFSGSLPPSLGSCISLLKLGLSYNNFSGLIPPDIMDLPSISVKFDLSYNSLSGSIPFEVGSLTHLALLDMSNNRLSGPLPISLAKCASLERLYLQGNSLEGEIPGGMSALMGLQYLDLSRNNFSGPIPSFLEKIHLNSLNLSFNRMAGEVPTKGVFRNLTALSLDGNRQLCGGISELKFPPCSLLKPQKKHLSTLFKILIPILAAGGMFLVLIALFFIKRNLRKNEVSSEPSPVGSQFIRLSYADLLKATAGFSETNLLGAGRFGSVYKGVLDDGHTQVAVKVLNLSVRGASKSFMAECNALRDVRHRNVLKILSVCESIDFRGNDFKALVYDFKANGSLEKWLHQCREQEGAEQNGDFDELNMMQRLNIAVDVAQAIEYLHFGTDSSIVHGDLKPSNILVDLEMTACVGDFGLAKIVSDVVPSHDNNSSIGIQGTIGYVPPEYGTMHSISTQGDVYSYGIVLLELFTNKRPTDDLFGDHFNLHNFVNAALPDRVMEIIDPQLGTEPRRNNDKIKECVAAILTIGVSCSNEIPRERMSMNDVVNSLRKIQKLLSNQRT